MKTTPLRLMLAGLAALWLLMLSACGGGSDAPPAAPGTVQGRVLASADGTPVADARVSVAGLSTRTAADGSFTLASVPAAGRAVLRIEATGFVDGLVTTPVASGQTALTAARLVRAAAPVTFDAAAAATLTSAGSVAQVDLPAASLVHAATGAAATGTVTATVTPIDPAADPQSMPGDYSVSDTERIESFGAIQVTLRDAAGAALNLKPGSQATIRIPLASRSTNPPATIPLYFFNETTGLWVREGTATLAGTAPSQYYEGQVSHFSYWNADQVQDTIYVNGCVRNPAGTRLADALVTSTGVDYSGSATDLTDAEGNFRVAIRKGSRASIVAESGNTSNTVVVGPSQTDITLPECLVIAGSPVAPIILEQPVSVTVAQGQAAYFFVVATGTRPLRYQWQRNGVNLPGATYEFLVVGAATPGDAGTYTVVVTNQAGTATSNGAVLTVEVPVAPSITTQPTATSVAAGATASFTVQAAGTGPLRYQWQRNGTDIAGATAASYTTPATALADNGALFRVQVSNIAGNVFSEAAALTVTGPALSAPVITTEPADATLESGLAATFSVATTGSPVPTYQWRRNGVDIPGATSASYTTPVLTPADSGALYSVVARNSEGTATSRNALLTVNAAAGLEEKTRLMRLLGLSFNFYQAAALPLQFTSDDGATFIDAATVCASGTLTGTLNGGALPGTGADVPASGTLAATASNCLLDGSTTYTGSSSVSYNLTSRSPFIGTATASVTNLRVVEATNGVVASDITANGSGSLAFSGSVAGTDTTESFTLTPAAGATLLSGLNNLTATFASGSVGVTNVTRNNRTLPLSTRVSYNALTFNVGGANYVAEGFYQLNFDLQNFSTTASGEVRLTTNGVTVGRIYGNDQGLFIEVDGVAQPFRVRGRVGAR